MDTRLIESLLKAMNIKNDDAKIIKNAGVIIMHPFGSIIRSIILAIYEFSAEDVIVFGHHGYGMSNLDINSIMKKIVDREVAKETISILYNSGIDVEKWLHELIINHHIGSLKVVVNGYESNN